MEFKEKHPRQRWYFNETQLRTLFSLLSYDRVTKMINIFVLISNTVVSLSYICCWCQVKWRWNVSRTGLSYQWNSCPCEYMTKSLKLCCAVHKLMWSNLRCLADPCLSLWGAFRLVTHVKKKCTHSSLKILKVAYIYFYLLYYLYL